MSLSLRLNHPSPLLGLALLLTAVGAHAQEAASPALTLGETLQRASDRNPALIAQGFHERAAEALIEQAGLRPNPTLDATLENFAGTGRARGADSLETTVQASQTFERGGKRDKRVALAIREREAAASEFAVRRTDVLAASATAFVETLAAQQRLKLAEELLSLAQETLGVIDNRVSVGVALPAEAARARAALAFAQADVARARARLTAARVTLAATWGGSPDEVPLLAGTVQVPDALPTVENFFAQLSRHPRLALQQAVTTGRRAALELQQAQAVQDVTVGGGLRFLRDGNDAAFVAGVSVPLPFRNRNQGNIRAARETLAGAEQGVRAVEIELRAAFTAAWQDLIAAHLAAQNLRRDALPATEEAYAAVRRAYEQGVLPLIDVLDAQRSLVALRRELLDTEAAYAAALTRVEALTDPAFPTLTTLINRS